MKPSAVTTNATEMEGNEQSIKSLVVVGKKDKPEIIPKQSNYMRSSNDIEKQQYLMKGKHQPIKHPSEGMNEQIDNGLSQDIQKEAAEYLLQLRKQYTDFGHTDKFILKPPLNKIHSLSNSVPTQNHFFFAGKYF